jgi:hypothetical protein
MRRVSPTVIAGLGTAALALAAAALTLAAPARAAKLVGGPEQAAIARAFDSSPAHRRLAIVSIRASTLSPAWAVVRSVAPEESGRTSSHASPITLQSTFYDRLGGRELQRQPPPAVRSELEQDFRVAIVYRGSGAETIGYQQAYHSVCAGAGDFTDTEQETVSPLSWNVRYVVDLDDLLSAIRGSRGPALVPSVTFKAGSSTLSAVEQLVRTVIDVGCNNTATTFSCKATYQLAGPPPLSFVPDLGLVVGIPLSPVTSGDCNPDDYTLGPSLFDSGATTALVGRLDVLGGELPADPYAPVAVSWPAGSAAQAEGFITSPCQGDGAACQDDLHWKGTVTLEPVS